MTNWKVSFSIHPANQQPTSRQPAANQPPASRQPAASQPPASRHPSASQPPVNRQLAASRTICATVQSQPAKSQPGMTPPSRQPAASQPASRQPAISLEKMIKEVIFLIVFSFLRYSLTLSCLNLPLKSSSTTSRTVLAQFSTGCGWKCHDSQAAVSHPTSIQAVSKSASQLPASPQPAVNQTPARSQAAASQPPASCQPASEKMIIEVIFLIVFCFLRYSLTLSCFILLLKSSSTTSTRQLPDRHQPTSRQSAASQLPASPPASRQPSASQKLSSS